MSLIRFPSTVIMAIQLSLLCALDFKSDSDVEEDSATDRRIAQYLISKCVCVCIVSLYVCVALCVVIRYVFIFVIFFCSLLTRSPRLTRSLAR
jgi:hypothetical protein